jgi:hypothetical protein
VNDSTLLQLRDLALILGVALVIVVGMGLYLVRRYRSNSRPHEHYPAAQRFQGQGSGTAEAQVLIAAQYRIDFQFPDEVLVKLELIEADTGNSDLILLKSGSGTDGFVVENAGRFLFQVEAQNEDARWSFTIKPVGMMGRAL